MKNNEFLTNFSNLARPLSNIKNIALVLLAFYLSGTEAGKYLWPAVLGIVSLSFVSSAMYLQNSFYDKEIDKENKNKEYYAKAVEYFGQKTSTNIFFVLALAGFAAGLFINAYFFSALSLLFLSGFFYSMKGTRFKEKPLLDVLFGAVFTYFFRFAAAWFIFSESFPPFLAISGLVVAKAAGYLLYKEADRAYFKKANIKNSITSLSKRTVILLSVFFWVLAVFSFILMCLNSVFNIGFLGSLPVKFLPLIFFAAPPLAAIYLKVSGVIKTEIKYLRTLGFIYWILVIATAVMLF
ncbi:MAG: UbiA family prenyltransferase [Candidatus Staskawiczbacteria bacterium]|nr:UbiA family prenyltransferase [Candidatus Staskawiczbacteria bacterium]